MKIVHFCLSCFYVDNFSYQENELVAQNVADGHEVTVIASTESFDEKGRVVYVSQGDYLGSDGARVIRLPYRNWLPHQFMRKIRMHPGVYSLLEQIAPDVILFHGLGGWELATVACYKQKNSNVRVFVDSHTDANNSAKGWISSLFLHKILYRYILNFSLRNVEKILCVNIDAMVFAEKIYGVPKDKLEFYPLGGKIISSEIYEGIRKRIRDVLSVKDDALVFVQSGKMDKKKKIVESLIAFGKLDDENARFFIVGYINDDVSDVVNDILKKDARIVFLGWKHPDELFELLCAADIYVQPGTQSATMQMSLCAHCAVIIDDIPSHFPYVKENGWLVGKELSLAKAFLLANSISEKDRKIMQDNSGELAERMLDYKNLAKRLYS